MRITSCVLTRSKPKKPVDPNRPKKPLTAYMLFSQEIRAELKLAQPELKMLEVCHARHVLKLQLSKVMGEKWKAMTEDEKAVYNNRYKTAMEQVCLPIIRAHVQHKKDIAEYEGKAASKAPSHDDEAEGGDGEEGGDDGAAEGEAEEASQASAPASGSASEAEAE